jgi:hypothetical protein
MTLLYVKNQNAGFLIYAGFISLIADGLVIGYIYVFYLKTTECERSLIVFHDFLIGYK